MEGLWKSIAKKKLQESRVEGRIMVFKNMIRRGFEVKDAMSLAEITEEQAKKDNDVLQKGRETVSFPLPVWEWEGYGFTHLRR